MGYFVWQFCQVIIFTLYLMNSQNLQSLIYNLFKFYFSFIKLELHRFKFWIEYLIFVFCIIISFHLFILLLFYFIIIIFILFIYFFEGRIFIAKFSVKHEPQLPTSSKLDYIHWTHSSIKCPTVLCKYPTQRRLTLGLLFL